MKQYNNRRTAFSLIELILYVALVGIFLTGAVQFAWNIIYSKAKFNVQQQVNQNLRFATKRILFEVRNASSITSVSSSSITLANTDRTSTVIDLSGGRIRVGYGSGSPCTIASPCFLTSDDVIVSPLTFTNLSSGASPNETTHIRFTIAMQNAGSGRSEYSKTQTYTSSAEVRSH